MPRESSLKSQHMRARIAAAAARLMAEDGIDDFALAKRKAARQLGAESSQALPNNDEIEDALRAHLELYQPDEQREHIQALREEALDLMALLQDFRPYLCGAVLAGTAGPYTPIELQLFTDDSKLVEIFLLDRGMLYETAERRPRGGERTAVCVLRLDWDGQPVTLAVHPVNDERVAPRGASGARAERVNAVGLRQLLDGADE